MNKLVLIDGNAILHRAYHALPSSLTTKQGEPINAVYGFVTMLLKIIEDLEPEALAVCFDEKGPTFRNEMDENYQTQRPEADKELISQFEKAREITRAFGISVYAKEGYEADDVIGTIASQCTGENTKSKQIPNEIIVVTGDKDIMQLVNDKVKLYMPQRSLKDAKLFGRVEVKEKMGVEPEQIVDLKALIGDPSDNYKGVPGIGPKTAEDLLSKYKTFERIYENLSEISEKTREKLEDGRGSGELSKKLATIVRDAPIKFDLKKAEEFRIDNPKAFEVFEKWGFRTIPERIRKMKKEMDIKKQMNLI